MKTAILIFALVASVQVIFSEEVENSLSLKDEPEQQVNKISIGGSVSIDEGAISASGELSFWDLDLYQFLHEQAEHNSAEEFFKFFNEDLADYLKGFYDDANSDVERSLNDAAAYAEQIRGTLSTAAPWIDSLAIRNLFSRLDSTLEDQSNHASELAATIAELRNNWNDQIDDVESRIANNASDWSDQILDDVSRKTNDNQDAHSQAQSIIQEVIERSQNSLERCKNEALNELNRHEGKINRSTSSLNQTHQDLTLNLEICVTNEHTSSGRAKCRTDLNRAGREIRKTTSDYKQLNKDGIKLTRTGYANRRCIAAAVNEFELGKLNAQLQTYRTVIQVYGTSAV